MSLAPRIRQKRSSLRVVFAFGSLIVGLGIWALFHFAYELGAQAFLIAALAGSSLFVTCEAVYTVVAAVLGWPRETNMNPGEVLAGLLSRGFW